MDNQLTDKYGCSIVARIIWTLPFPVLHLRGVNPEHMVLMGKDRTGRNGLKV